MRDRLLAYYDRELQFIRKLVAGFAEAYPEVAGRLLLEPTKCEDPHVERIIEAFSMLTARISLRLDDDFSEVTDSLLGILYPHFLNPIPSATIVQLALDPEQGKASEGVLVPRHTLMHAQPVDGVRCRFRSCYPVRLWPIEVASVELSQSYSFNSYPSVLGVDEIIPVDVYLPGCPPRPEALIHALQRIQQKIERGEPSAAEIAARFDVWAEPETVELPAAAPAGGLPVYSGTGK